METRKKTVKKKMADSLILAELKNLKGWMKDIHNDVAEVRKQGKIANGRLSKAETSIALVRQRNKLNEEHRVELENQRRKKTLFWGGAGLTLVFIIIEVIFKYLLN